MEPYEAEGEGYMRVHDGDQIQLSKDIFGSGLLGNLYSTYAYGRKLNQAEGTVEHAEQGWFPIHVFRDAETQLRTAGAQIV